MRSSFRLLKSLLSPGRTRLMLGLVILAIFTASFEALSAVMAFVMIRVIENPEGILTQWPFFWLKGLETSSLTLGVVVAALGCYALRSLLFLLEVFSQNRMVFTEAEKLAHRFLSAYVQAPYTFLLQRNSAEILHKVFQDIRNGFIHMLQSFMGILTELFMLLALLSVVMLISPRLTFGMMAFVGVLLLIVMMPLQRLTQKWGRQSHMAGEKAYQFLQQLLMGIKEIRLTHRTQTFLNNFSTQEQAFCRARNRFDTASQLPRTLIEVIVSIAAGGALYYMISQQWSKTDIVAVLGVYVYVVFRVMPSLNRLSNYVSKIQYYRQSIENLAQTYADVKALHQPRTLPSQEVLSFQNDIKIDNLLFCYPGNETQPTLQNISFSIQRGDCIGIVGTTGSGKSTLVDILLGILEPQLGGVFIDGQDIRHHLQSWQTKIGYVPQAIYLLDDSLEENIYFGSKTRDPQRLLDVIRMAQLDTLVQSLPQGLKTFVGEQGLRLSGGERQRIAIARALYHNPEVLVFDEATSALDNETERKIIETIHAIRQDKTVIMIAHRLSTIEKCDRLILLKNGNVVTIDSYQDMLNYQSDFQQLSGAA